VCRGTVEERIELLLESKAGLARDLLEGAGEIPLTDFTDEQLLALVSLDMRKAAAEDASGR
jgi:hypothetical protein